MSQLDEQTISAVLAGDKERYREIVHRYQNAVYAIAWSHLGDRELSQDAAQETFIKAYRYLATLRHPEKFAGWITRIARNVSLTFGRVKGRELELQKRWRIEQVPVVLPEPKPEPTLQDQLSAALAELPALHREALTLYYIEGMSIREAATMLGIQESAMKTRLHRARTALREEIERGLADSLRRLQPDQDLSHSVMTLIPPCPIAAGGSLSLLGKVGAMLSTWFTGLGLMLWMGFAQIAVFYFLMSWMSRMYSANIREGFRHQFRKDILRHNMIIVVLSVGVIFPVTLFLVRQAGARIIFQLGSQYLLWWFWRAIRFLRINTSRFFQGQVFTLGAMLISFVAIGFLNAPYITFLGSMALINILLYFTHKDIPCRMDYNLFLRGATEGLQESRGQTLTSNFQMHLEQMKSFAKFLGEQWLALDYAVYGDQLIIKLPSVRNSLREMLGIGWGGQSKLVIESNGVCRAQISSADWRAISILKKDCPARDELCSRVEGAVRLALEHFIRGQETAATEALCVQPDRDVFKAEFHGTRNYRIMFLVIITASVLALLLYVLAQFLSGGVWSG